MRCSFERWNRPSEQDLAAYARLMAQAFGSTEAQAARWIGRVGTTQVRVVASGEALAAGLAAYEAGLYLGGRAVPCAAVAGVAVRPEHRRQGLADAMLRRLLLEAHARELPLSALYAANHPLYRSVGYEAAGSRTLAAIAPDRIGVVERAGTIHALEAQDEALRRTLYRRVAQRQPGHLDREAGLWRRATHDRDDEPHPSWVAVSAAGSPEGYVTLERRGGAGIAQQLGALDLVATTPWALRRLLCFLSDFSSVVAEVQFPTGPGDPVGLVLHEPRLRVVEHQVWLLRVVSIAPALAARGWHPTATGRVDLEVEDDLLPGNAGRWVLEVAGGQARVGRGGAGSVRLGPRGLAALYSGYLRPEAAVAAGLLEGPDEQLAVLGGLCAGPSPWMMEMF